MTALLSLSLLLVITNFLVLVFRHTQIWYPLWRNNSFEAPFMQTIYPCAGISDTAGTNRTLWPLDGGSLNVAFHDGAAIMFVNLGLGVNPTNFNISLLTVPLNETGAENLCFPKLTLPFGLPIEGTQASIQFATSNPKMAKGYTMWVYQGPNTRALWPISISHSVPISPLAAMPPSYRLTSV